MCFAPTRRTAPERNIVPKWAPKARMGPETARDAQCRCPHKSKVPRVVRIRVLNTLVFKRERRKNKGESPRERQFRNEIPRARDPQNQLPSRRCHQISPNSETLGVYFGAKFQTTLAPDFGPLLPPGSARR